MKPHHSVIVQVATHKFAEYTAEQCAYAIRDIHNTLSVMSHQPPPEYVEKLYAELDAARARQLALHSEKRFTRAQLMEIVTWAHAALGYMAITGMPEDKAEYARRRDQAWAAICAEGIKS